jgi:MFS family permease
VQLLYKLHARNGVATQRTLSLLALATTVTDIATGPIFLSASDYYGRKPFLLAASIVGFFARLEVARAPTLLAYSISRVALSALSKPYTKLISAALVDMRGRATAEHIRDSCTLSQLANATSVVGIFLGGQLSPRRGFFCAAVASATACAALLGLEETLPKSGRKRIKWRQMSNPLLSLSFFFNKSRPLAALGVLMLLQAIPSHNNTHQIFRRTRFNWGQTENMYYAIGRRVVEFASPLTLPLVVQQLGLRGSAVWSERLGAISSLNNAFCPATLGGMPLFLNHAMGLFRHGMFAVDCAVAVEAGQSEV